MSQPLRVCVSMGVTYFLNLEYLRFPHGITVVSIRRNESSQAEVPGTFFGISLIHSRATDNIHLTAPDSNVQNRFSKHSADMPAN